MARNDHLVKLVLTAIKDFDRSRSELTSRIKNYAKADRQAVIEEIVTGGMVRFYEGRSGKGRRPVMVAITDKGLERLKELDHSFKDSSVWSI